MLFKDDFVYLSKRYYCFKTYNSYSCFLSENHQIMGAFVYGFLEDNLFFIYKKTYVILKCFFRIFIKITLSK